MCNGMKKAISSLLGLILLVSFAFTGCQPGTESEVSTGEPASSAVTESSVSQNETEMESAQPEETVDGLKITAEGSLWKFVSPAMGSIAANMTRTSRLSRLRQTVRPLKSR